MKIAFIWHMHQPYYKNLLTNEYMLPWVRLHATKDYYDMAAILDDFPGINQTFNLVPSLLEQIDDYSKGEGHDKFLCLSFKKSSELTDDEKVFILNNFFLAHWENMIKPFPRYWELLQKRGFHVSKEKTSEVIRYFTANDYLDLQCLFNLCWIDPLLINSDPFLSAVREKGRGFSEEEKEFLLLKQKDIIANVIPNYKRLMEKGRIELTTTPFYHPILPLLCDTNIARVSTPDAVLPNEPFIHPEDAELQIKRAVKFHKETFGIFPKGIWPSEGSVSEKALSLISSNGIEWIATDEEILEHSANCFIKRRHDGILDNPDFLYKPYLFKDKEGRDLSILFRDHQLSDLIGFVYSSWDPESAARNFMDKLHSIRTSLGKSNKKSDHLVTVILDGENCWEHYKNDGHDFLASLYAMVEEDELIDMVTVSGFLEQHPPEAVLNKIYPGSWIGHNFKIWIGHEEDNRAWDLLKMTRDALVAADNGGSIDKEKLVLAWEHIYIAEGSDWCWWYGDDHSTENDADFDRLFRQNLMNVYTLIEKQIPEKLLKPVIISEKHILPPFEVSSFINPSIDGEVTSYFEWLGAAIIDLKKTGGTMHKADYILSHIYCGANRNFIFMRIDFNPKLECDGLEGMDFMVFAKKSGEANFESVFIINTKENYQKDLIIKNKNNYCKYGMEAKLNDIIEIKIPIEILDIENGNPVDFYVSVSRNGGELERWPSKGCFTFLMPPDDLESKIWNAYA